MKVKQNDRWTADKQSPPVDSRFLPQNGAITLLCLLFFIGITLTASYFLLNSPAFHQTIATAKSDTIASDNDRLVRIERSFAAVQNRLTRLETSNNELRREVALLSGPRGVVARIIDQLRNLKGQEEVLRRNVLDALRGDDGLKGDGAMAEGMVSEDMGGLTDGVDPDLMRQTAMAPIPQARPHHEVVTPVAAKASAAKADEGQSSEASE